MLTVLIETKDQEEALARTLASLVGAAVEGIVRDVLICDLGSRDQTHYVAEHAGCQYIPEGGLASGLRLAKGEWLLLLEPGARMMEGWTESVLAHASAGSRPARFSRRGRNAEPWLKRLFRGRRPLAEGLLLTKRQALSLSGDAATAEALARRLRTRRIDGQIIVAPVKT